MKNQLFGVNYSKVELAAAATIAAATPRLVTASQKTVQRIQGT